MKLRQLRQTLGAKWSTFILLLPLALFGSVYFGWSAFWVLLVSTLSAMVAGALIQWSNNGPLRWFNPGSMVTGLLIGLTLSAQTPFYMIIIGGFVAEYLGKQALPAQSGGRMKYLFNPAVLGRSAIAILETYDPIPYADLSTGASLLFKEAGGLIPPHYWEAFLGLTKGAIGETSTLLLLIVGFLMLRYVVIKREAAIAMILSVPVTVFLLPDTVEIVGHAPWISEPLVYLLGGPTLLMAFFFLTAPETTPNTVRGGIVFGIGLGVLSVLGRMYTSIPGAEMYAILIMNLTVPWLNKRSLRYAVKTPYSVASFYAPASASEADGKPCIEVQGQGPSSFADYAMKGGFTELRRIRDETTPDIEVLKRIFASGLLGCGGSHIPLIKKWEAAIPYQPHYLVVNGLEGEPFTFKDYFLMARYPQIVLEGIAISCRVLGIREALLVINSAYKPCYQALEAVLREQTELLRDIDIRLVHGPEVDLYVVGEETALLNYLEGKRGEPRLKPPFPHQQGLWDKPTIINNVETLSWIPVLLNTPERFAHQHPKLVTLLGDAEYPGIYEINLGDSLLALTQQAQARELAFIEVGGISGGLVPAAMIDVAYDDDALAHLGVQVGSGTLRLFDSSRDPLHEMSQSIEYFMHESCGRCTPCRVGTQELNKFAGLLRAQQETSDSLNWLHNVAHTMQTTSTCGLGRAAPIPLLTYLHHFRKPSDD